MIAIATMEVGFNIKSLRAARAMTQEDLAASAGVGVATVQRAEASRPISAASLASIAAAFGVPASKLGPTGEVPVAPYVPLDRISTGRALVALLRRGRNVDFGFCELDSIDDARAIQLLQELCEAIAAIEAPLRPVDQVVRELEAKCHLDGLASKGFHVGGGNFDVQCYDVDDDEYGGISILMAQWIETRVVLRVGRDLASISRAFVMDGLGEYESPRDGVIFPERLDDRVGPADREV
jgi:transcriptional regulator with XRE-family HTH domain